MPIIGMTRREDLQDAAHRLVYGELRKGGPKTDPKKPGPDLSYFRFTSERPEVLAAFRSAYPGEPKVIDVYLPFDSVERVFSTWMEEYDAGGLIHRCDGRTMTRWRTGDGGYQDGERPCPYFSGQKNRTKDTPGCKQVGRLLMVIPELVKAGHVGLVSLESHSINDLVSITSSLLDIEAKAGRLNGILCSVMRVSETISTPAWRAEDKAAGKRNRTEKHLVKIVPAAEWVMARLNSEAHEQMALAQGKPLELARRSQSTEDDWGDEDDDTFEEPPLPDTAPEGYVDGTDEDVEEGEFTPEPEPPAATDDYISAIKARLHEQATQGIANGATWKADPTSPENVKKINAGLAILLPNAEQRHVVRQYLLGHDSSSYTKGEIAALVGWLDMRKDADGATVPGAQAIADAKELVAFLCPPEPLLFEE